MTAKPRPAMLDLLRRIEDAGGWDKILDLIADGWTMRKIANAYGTDRVHLRRAMRQHVDQTLVNEAVNDGVDGMVEDAREAMEEATPETAHLRQAQMGAALKLAGFLNKEKFGENKGAAVQVNLSLSDLHLAAVRQVAAERPAINAAFRRVEPAQIPAEDPIDALLR